MFESIFLVLAVLFSIATMTAVVRGRSIGWFVPLWFLVSLASTELAPWLLASQVGLLLFGAIFGDSGSSGWYWGSVLLSLSALATLGILTRHFDTGKIFERALATALGDDFDSLIPLARRHRLSRQIDSKEWSHPFTFKRAGVRVSADIAYDSGGKRHLLDVYTPVTEGDKRPVMLQIHGGAWLLGHKAEQALPLLHHMANLGWVCVSINYRLSPMATFPDHVIDVKKAIAWVRENIADWGGDPDFIAVTGGSAGGHLASLAALSANYAPWQPGFEDVDTSIQAAMPLYGAYDLSDRYGIRRHTAIDNPILSRVFKTSKEEAPELYERASPISWVSAEAPPFFVVQGVNDSLVWVEEARRFVDDLSAVSDRSVTYAELPGAQHSFETIHSPRTSHFLNAAALWLEWAWADWQLNKPSNPGD